MCQPSRVPFNTRAPRENLAALKHKIHQKCMKLTWGGEYLRPVSAWEPETMSGFLYPALTQRGIFFAVNSSDPYRAPRVATLAGGDFEDHVASTLFLTQIPGI